LARVLFSTGPIDNETDPIYPEPIYSTVDVIVLNNHNQRNANIIVRVYELNGTKTLVQTERRTVGPNASENIQLNVSTIARFEIQLIIRQKGAFNRVRRTVLKNAIGRDESGEFVSRLPLRLSFD
jgi:hypothetical protein